MHASKMLLESNGARLLRLLRRFEHVASVPGGIPELLRARRDLSLHFEAQYRTPIFGRWPPIARFLAQHRDRIAALTSPVVAGLCERWLTSTPVELAKGVPMPFRNEFAQLALAMARELQYGQAIRIMYLGDFGGPNYPAALAAVPDLPVEISEWLLEMARRRERSPDLVQRIREHRTREAEQHRERLKTDADYRARHQRRVASPTFIPSGRKLPPWPLGPRGDVDGHFQKTLLHSNATHMLMRVRPSVAAEILLAAIIEGSPEESYGRRNGFDHELGLDYDHEGYPTAYWKNRFFAFLQISPDIARNALHRLVNFCTERWEHDAMREDGSKPPTTSIALEDGTVRETIGNFRVFTWSQSDSHHNGQLFSALASLEKWLCILIDAGVDITSEIDDLLRNSNSVGIIGVLINIGKYRPDLYKGPLKPLLAIHRLYVWDYHRVKNSADGFFDGMSWIREGEAVFEKARDWTLAPYRRASLGSSRPTLSTRNDQSGISCCLLPAPGWLPMIGKGESSSKSSSRSLIIGTTRSCTIRRPEKITASFHIRLTCRRRSKGSSKKMPLHDKLSPFRCKQSAALVFRPSTTAAGGPHRGSTCCN